MIKKATAGGTGWRVGRQTTAESFATTEFSTSGTYNQMFHLLAELRAIGGRLAVSDRKLWGGAPGGLPDRIRFDLIRLEAPLLDYVTRAGGLWPGDDDDHRL